MKHGLRLQVHGRQGQTSMEFVAMLGFIMIVFAAFYTVFVDRQVALQQEQESLMAEAVAHKAAFEMKLALAQGNGYTRNFTIPSELAGTPYDIGLNSTFVELRWNGTDQERSLFADAVVDTTSLTGDLTPGDNTVKNRQGELYVE